MSRNPRHMTHAMQDLPWLEKLRRVFLLVVKKAQ